MDTWKKELYVFEDLKIHVVRAQAKKPPLLFLHGLLQNADCFSLLAKNLQKHYEIIMPDARGHGLSSHPKKGYNYETLAIDVIKLTKALKLKNPILMGHSMGGMTAALAASENPFLFSKVVLVDPAFLSQKQQEEVLESNLVQEHQKILNNSKEEYLNNLLKRHQNKRPLELIQHFLEARFQTALEAFDIFRSPYPSFESIMQKLKVPCLLITGDTTPVISYKLAQKLLQMNSLLKYERIEKAGHAVLYDQPLAFCKLVHSFIQSH